MPQRKRGKMSVVTGQRNVPHTPQNRQLDACVKAKDLVIHTIKICANKNIFLPEYQTSFTDDIIRTAKNIFIYAWTANNIRVNNADDWMERKRLQKRSVIECNNLLALISIAKTLYHLKHKKVTYWVSLTVEARNYIKKWMESDSKRYGKA